MKLNFGQISDEVKWLSSYNERIDFLNSNVYKDIKKYFSDVLLSELLESIEKEGDEIIKCQGRCQALRDTLPVMEQLFNIEEE